MQHTKFLRPRRPGRSPGAGSGWLSLALAAACSLTGASCASESERDEPDPDRQVAPPGHTLERGATLPTVRELEAKRATKLLDTANADGPVSRAPEALRVDPELEARLEAQYQAALKGRVIEESHDHGDGHHEEFDFDAVLEQIKEAEPPRREELMMEYISAVYAEPESKHTELLERLTFKELKDAK